MAKENPDVILLHGRDDEHAEGIATETFTPGAALSVTGVDTSRAKDRYEYSANDGSVAGARLVVALEDQHGGTGKGIDEDYEDGQNVTAREVVPGDEFYGFIFDGSNAGGTAPDTSANATVTEGDELVYYAGAGDTVGTFRAYASGSDSDGAIQVEALESVDNSDGSTPARCAFKVV